MWLPAGMVLVLLACTNAVPTATPVSGASRSDSAAVSDLPLVEVPASAGGPTFAVILSGDGGWAAGDKAMASAFARKGVPVVGLEVPSYLRVKRTPDEVGADLSRLLRHYLAAWDKSRFILVGYSHGADITPFVASRLPADLRNRIDLIALLSLEQRASFQFHMEDIVAQVAHDDAVPILPELEKLRGVPLLCVMGAGEKHSLCPSLPPSLAKVVTRDGGHRISGSAGAAAADLILDTAQHP
jgi:type IV secretory pathway VirJ component